jgi:hypothetical protein
MSTGPSVAWACLLELGNGGINLNLLLNTLLGAVGVTKADGSPVDDFGSAELAKGRMTEIVAGA